MIHAYDTGHINCATVMRAVAAGVPGVRVVPPARLLEGGAIFYGILRGTGALVREAARAGRTWYYIDNGYFRPGHYAGFYRVSANAYQFEGEAKPDWERWKALDLTLAPWQRAGAHVLICPPSEAYADHHGLPRDWGAQIARRLRECTDRPIRLRSKNTRTALQDDLRGAHALVTYASNAALAAIMAGVPVVTLGQCGASKLAVALDQIETPSYFEREPWLATLAGQQWTLDEVRAGVMWRAIGG